MKCQALFALKNKIKMWSVAVVIGMLRVEIVMLLSGCEANSDVNLQNKKFGIKLYISGWRGGRGLVGSTVILSLPLIQEGQLSVSGERMCTILVNRIED